MKKEGSLKRRHFLQAMTALGASASCFGKNRPPAIIDWSEGRYGPLIKDPKGVLDLPKGFTYHIFSETGSRMDDGFCVPSALDGMAAFPGPKGTVALVRNHELRPNDPRVKPYFDQKQWDTLPAELLYDQGREDIKVVGGTSTIIYDPKTQTVKTHYLSLAGTSTNCAGGRTPWNTWISCEETTHRSVNEKANTSHGYCFEVDPFAGKLQAPRKLPGLGRFRHEAVAIDPRDGTVYLTEDLAKGLFYRFLPEKPNDLAGKGRLQALSIIDMPGKSTANREDLGSEKIPLNQKMRIRWIDMDEIDNPNGDLSVRGKEMGANTFCRGEGIDFGFGQIVFSCTSGGPAKQGQVWRLIPGKHTGKGNEEDGTLELFCEPNDSAVMSMVDNLCIAPNGDVILAEDNGDTHMRILGLTPDGKIYNIARNMKNMHEVAGCTWSPDGKTLFFNIFDEGGTVAVRGPW